MLDEEEREKMGLDASTDPHGEKRWALSDNQKADGSVSQRADLAQPAEMIIERDELYRASFTPKGAYITRVSIKFAFYQGWKIVNSKNRNDPVKDSLLQRVNELNKQYKLKQVFIQMVRTGAIFGRSLVYIQERPTFAYKNPKDKLYLRVSPVSEPEIQYDNASGFPIEFRLNVRKGRQGNAILTIPAEKAVLFVWDQDECGNMFQGIPALIAAYDTILRSEVVSEEFSTTVAERGLGIVDVLDKKAKTLEDLKKVRQAFKLGRDRVFVHGENYEVNVKAGISSGFDFDASQTRYTKDVSSGTGYPGMAMEGVQVGAVTGSETDQDNRAQMYRMIQEMCEHSMLDIYHLIDPKIEDFDLEWEFEIKQDRQKRAQTLATYGGAINQIQDLITVNQALSLMDLPTILPKEGGDLLVSEWIALKSPTIDTNPDDPNSPNNDIKAKDVPKEDPKPPEESVDPSKLDTVVNSAGPVAKDSEDVMRRILKAEIAKRLIEKGNSYDSINVILKRVCGDGLSASTIAKMKEENKK